MGVFLAWPYKSNAKELSTPEYRPCWDGKIEVLCGFLASRLITKDFEIVVAEEQQCENGHFMLF